MSRNKDGERVIKISFSYDIDMIEKVRSVPDRKYHKEQKCWSAPVYVKTIDLLVDWGFELDKKLQRVKQKEEAHKAKIVNKGIPGLKGKPYPYQSEGVAFIDQCKGRALIADEMGLGKTIEALAWLQLHLDLRPVIILVPASLKLNWKKEARTWMPKPNVEVLSGIIPWTPTKKMLIINYDILPHWVDTLKKLRPKVLIGDECHYFKNNKAQRTKAVKKLAKGIANVIFLSGTPIENRPIEIFNAVNILKPDLFPNWFEFGMRYCKGKHIGHGWNFNGASNTEKLHAKLTNTIMIRRLKKDVLPELPPKIYSFEPIELDNTKEYKFAENNLVEYIRQQKGDEAAERAAKVQSMIQIEVLKQVAVKGKLRQAKQWIKDFLEIEDKLVVFATHKFVIKELMDTFGEVAVKLDGSVTSDAARQKAVDDFQNNPKIKLFVGNIQSAGKGITLTAASNVVILELPWTPGALNQVIDRLHRIGQKDSVNVHYLFAENSIEEDIATWLDRKRQVMDAVLDGKVTSADDLLRTLINKYKKQLKYY